MKKLLLSLGLMLGIAVTVLAGYPAGYYDQMDGKQRESLKAAVKKCVRQHNQLSYSTLPDYWQYTDVYPELIDGCKRWWDMYSDEVYLIGKDQTARKSFSSYGMQREHSVPKSWWKKDGSVEYTPAYSDMWNLYPSNGAANQAKLNYPFGPTNGNPSFNNGVSKVGAPKNGYGGGSSKVFEPADEYKGDFARSMFYMACVYNDINWVINYMYRADDYPTLVPWAYNMLLQWARQDPVSQKEIDRNNLVEQYQGNRNPFVDFPELAEYIWGVRSTETFYIANQENSDPTPPITGDPQLTKPVNGEALDFGRTAVGHAINDVLQIQGLNFTEPLSLRLVGADKDCFKLSETQIPASTLNANGGYLFDITYLPETTGTHEARLTLYDGGLSGSVAVTLRGESLPVPDLTPLQALEATDITDNSYTANWNPAKEIADYYVVTRVRYIGADQEAETFETGETSLTITDRDPDVAESYTVAYSRLGMLSPDSNTIYVAPGSGVLNVEYNVPYRAFGSEGVLLILSGDGNPVRGLSISDMSGRVMITIDAADGQEISLPRGVYLLSAPGHRPHKVMIF